MGTRSTIGFVEGDGFRGRYCHWDGYPTYMGRVLSELIRRDGHEKVIAEITSCPSWSSIEPLRSVEDTSGVYDDRFVAVEGYGVAHTDKQSDGEDPWNVFDGSGYNEDIGWTEWCYAIDPGSGRVSVFATFPEFRLIGSFDPYTVDESEFQRLQDRAWGEDEVDPRD